MNSSIHAHIKANDIDDFDRVACLSRREREVLALIAHGLTNSAISGRLFIEEKTVDSHVRSIYAKLGLGNERGLHRRVCAVRAWLRSGASRTPLKPVRDPERRPRTLPVRYG